MSIKFKKIISFTFSLIIVLGAVFAFNVTSRAETYDDFEYYVSDDEVTIEKYIGNGRNVTIPSEINGIPVRYIGGNAFKGCTCLESVDICKSVKDIGPEAFYDCSNLNFITFDSDSQLNLISYHAFHNCSSLTEISIPNSVKNIGFNAFIDCVNLKTINLPINLEYIDAGIFTNTAYYNDKSNWKDGLLYIDDYLFAANSINGECIIEPDTKAIACCAFEGEDELTSITIPKGIK